MNIGIAAKLAIAPIKREKFRYIATIIALALMLKSVLDFQVLDRVTKIDQGDRTVALLGGDFRIDAGYREFEEDELSFLVQRADQLTRSESFRSMTSVDGTSGPLARLSHVRAVDAAYPLSGVVKTEPQDDFQSLIELVDGRFGAVATSDLVAFFELELGDLIRIGDTDYEFRATLDSTPDLPAFQDFLLPSILISSGSLTAPTARSGPGLSRQSIQITLPPTTTDADFISDAKRAFSDRNWQIASANDQNERQFRLINIARSTLALAQIITIILYSLAIATIGFLQLDGQRNTDDWLRELGVEASVRFAALLIRLVVLVLISTIGAAFFAWITYSAIQSSFPSIAAQIDFDRPIWNTIIVRTALIYAAIILTTSWLAWQFAHRAPLRIASISGMIVAVFTATVGFWILSPFDDLFTSLATLVGLFIVFIVLMILAKTIIRRIKSANNAQIIAWKMFAHRGSRQELLATMLFGLALLVYIFSTVAFNLYAYKAIANQPITVSHYVADLLPEQRKNFETAFEKDNVNIQDIWPISRLHFNSDSARDHRLYRGDLLVGFFEEQPNYVEIIEGEWWQNDGRVEPKIAIDINFARDTGLGVGDSLSVSTPEGNKDVPIVAFIRSKPANDGFYLPLILNRASHLQFPYNYVVSVNIDAQNEGLFYRTMNDKFSNAIVISTKRAQARITQLINAAIGAVSLIGLNVLLATVIATSTFFGLYQRKGRYEIEIMHQIGASSIHRFANRFWQFAIPAVLTMVTILVLDYYLAQQIFDRAYQNEITAVQTKALLVTTVATVLLTVLFAVFGSYRKNNRQVDALTQEFRGDKLDF